jgi:hypothetical protein
VHSTHTDLCIVSFVYEINKGWERVPVKLVVHYDSYPCLCIPLA